MDMPKPGPEHARLMRFAGRWTGAEVLAPSPWGPGGAAHGTTILRVELDGMALVQEYVERKDGATVFQGHGIFMIDPQGSDVLWWWFDSMGFPPDGPSRGRWDGDVLLLEKATPMGEGRYRYEFLGDRYTFSMANRFPGQSEFTEMMRGDYARTV